MKRLFRLIEDDNGTLAAQCFYYENGQQVKAEPVDTSVLPGWLVTEFLGPSEWAAPPPDDSKAKINTLEDLKAFADQQMLKESPEPPKGKLPADFPGYKALSEADPPVHTYHQVRKIADAGTLIDIPGIGKATVEQINAALGETKEGVE
jgi:hypothetical protein